MTNFAKEKQSVVDACIRLADQGFLAGTGGNVGLRLEGDLFAVTPSAADYYSMRAEDICVLRFDGMVQIEGDKPASVERGMHACLMRAKPHCRATIHTHQPYASAVALLHVDLPLTLDPDRREIGDRVAVVPYWPSGTALLVRALAKRLKPSVNAYLLGSHGIICAAPDMEAAIGFVGRIEKAAARFLLQLAESHPDLPASIKSLVIDSLTQNVT